MTDKQLTRALSFLEFFSVDIDEENVYVNDGHTSVICNPDSEWNDFLGHSVLQVAESVAAKLNKKIKWM